MCEEGRSEKWWGRGEKKWKKVKNYNKKKEEGWGILEIKITIKKEKEVNKRDKDK